VFSTKTQYEFQKKISTAHAILDLTTTSFENINQMFNFIGFT